ncbi:MAG: restriction endonuclease subunit S [Bacteroidales bacterium]|nr:restriction endonuclease subunit S [Bacteroidales bacterium]
MSIPYLSEHKLKELIKVTRGASLSGQYFEEEGDLIRLTLGNFDYTNGGFKENTSKENLYYSGPVADNFIMNEGDIITPMTEQTPGLLGSTARIPESGKYIQSQDVGLVTCDEEKIDKDFCYYLLPSEIVKKQLSAGAQQTKIRHTSPDKIEACTVFIPSPKEQNKIGRFLSSIDKLINLKRKEITLMELMAKQIYDYWFVQFDFPNDEGKPYKSSGGKMIWNEKLKREIPEGWNDTTLDYYCKMYQPQTISTKLLNGNGKYPVYGANGIIGFYNNYNHTESEIVIACRGNSCGVVNRTDPFSWITGNAMVMAMKNSKYSNEYISQSLRYVNIRGAITGSGQPQITRENLKGIRIILPHDKNIVKYSEAVTGIVKKILKIREEINEIVVMREFFKPLLMTGQVTIKD